MRYSGSWPPERPRWRFPDARRVGGLVGSGISEAEGSAGAVRPKHRPSAATLHRAAAGPRDPRTGAAYRHHGLLRGRPTRRRDRDPARVAHDGLGLQRDVSRTDHRLANEAGTPLSRIRTRCEVPVVVHLHGGRVHRSTTASRPTSSADPRPRGARIRWDDAYRIDHGRDPDLRVPDGPAGWDALVPRPPQDFTGPQVYRGLAGFHLVADDHEATLGLPSGARDVPLMIVDRSFRADGSSTTGRSTPRCRRRGRERVCEWCPRRRRPRQRGAMAGLRGGGGALPVAAAQRLQRPPVCPEPRPDPSGTGLPFLQIGADASLMPAPMPVAEVVLSQSERADVIVDFARVPVGQTVTMHNGLSSGGRRVGHAVPGRQGQPPDTAPFVVVSPEGERGASLVDAPWKNTVDLDNGGDCEAADPVRRLPRPVRVPLPQPRARGHADDGDDRGGLVPTAFS